MERKLGRIVITGATGFLGGALARRLLQQGADVISLGRNETTGASFGEAFRQVDLNDLPRMIEVMKDASTVFHCGALSSPWGRANDFERANVQGTASVIEACKMGDVSRLVHVSTPSIYFRHHDGLNIREDATLPEPVNDYARTKLAAEKLVEASGLPAVILRPRAIFGPGDTTILPRLVRAMQAGKLRMIGDGNNLSDLTYIDNAVDALLLAGTASDVVLGKKFNITNGQPVRLWDAIRSVAALLDLKLRPGRIPRTVAMGIATAMEAVCKLGRISREPMLTRYGVGVLTASQTLDISAACLELGYVPAITVEEGLRRFADWWKTTALNRNESFNIKGASLST